MYDTVDTHDVTVYRTAHDNDDETHVLTYRASEDGDWVAVAVDIGPDLEPVDSDLIAVAASEDGIERRATAWMEDNPKGVAAGSGLLSGLGGGA